MFLQTLLLNAAVLLIVVAGDRVLDIQYPNISVNAVNNGNITLQSGDGGIIYINPGPGGQVYLEGVDIVKMIEMIQSFPPVWLKNSSVGFFGTYHGGETVDAKLSAMDPGGGKLRYELVSGKFPPGIEIDHSKGAITGIAPDATAEYTFTIRVWNEYGKSADAIFSMEIIETNQCTRNPCQNGALCVDHTGGYGYRCNCSSFYGGRNCEITCINNLVGVSDRNKIPDAQMSAFLTRETYAPHEGRLHMNSSGWCGENANSWLQVDLGQLMEISAVEEQSYSSYYYVSAYYVSYSMDGKTFQYIKTSPISTSDKSFRGTTSDISDKSNLPYHVTARFIRFHPISWNRTYFPCMKVEIYGCTRNTTHA